MSQWGKETNQWNSACEIDIIAFHKTRLYENLGNFIYFERRNSRDTEILIENWIKYKELSYENIVILIGNAIGMVGNMRIQKKYIYVSWNLS